MPAACRSNIEVRWHLDSILYALISNLAKELLDLISGHLKLKLDGTGVPSNIEVSLHLDSILDAPISNLAKSRNIKVPVFYLGGRGADRYELLLNRYKRLLRGFTDD